MLSFNNNNAYDHIRRERQVIELYNQGKSTRDIAKESRMSLRDISIILKKHGVNHEIASTDDDGNNNKKSHSNNEKATLAYRLFSEGRKPVQVAIELNLREGQINKFFREFWKLKRQYRLYEIYPQIEPCLESFLKLHKALKKKGLNPNNVEWFANAIETGAIKIPELQKQYAKLQDEVQVIDHQKVVSKAQLDNMNNQISILHNTIYQLSITCDDKRNEIAYLQNQIQALEGYVHGLENHYQQQEIH
jgi:chromosome segregation ATPase